jgi:hypothetical protein
MQVKPVGQYVAPRLPVRGVLLQQAERKKGEKSTWVRLWSAENKDLPVESGRRLVSLSGSESVILLDSGVELTLWGNLPQVTQDNSVAESRLILHAHPSLDADLTLERGRIILRNKRAGGQDALIRLRFDNPTAPKPTEEYFDITLSGATSAIVLDRVCILERDEAFVAEPKDASRGGPTAFMRVFAYGEGSAFVRYAQGAGYRVSKTDKSILEWGSRQGELGPPKNGKVPPWLEGLPVLKKDEEKLSRDKAVKAHEILASIAERKTIDVALAEMEEVIQRDLAREKKMTFDTFVNWHHVLTTREAIDDITRIYDDFQQERTPSFIRGACIQLLQQWIAWNRENDFILLDTLRDYHAKQPMRVKIMELLHPIGRRDADKPVTYQMLIDGLNSDLLPIRTLSHWHLLQLLPQVAPQLLPQLAKLPPYDPAMTAAQRASAVAELRKLIPPGQMPGEGKK